MPAASAFKGSHRDGTCRPTTPAKAEAEAVCADGRLEPDGVSPSEPADAADARARRIVAAEPALVTPIASRPSPAARRPRAPPKTERRPAKPISMRGAARVSAMGATVASRSGSFQVEMRSNHRRSSSSRSSRNWFRKGISAWISGDADGVAVGSTTGSYLTLARRSVHPPVRRSLAHGWPSRGVREAGDRPAGAV